MLTKVSSQQFRTLFLKDEDSILFCRLIIFVIYYSNLNVSKDGEDLHNMIQSYCKLLSLAINPTISIDQWPTKQQQRALSTIFQIKYVWGKGGGGGPFWLVFNKFNFLLSSNCISWGRGDKKSKEASGTVHMLIFNSKSGTEHILSFNWEFTDSVRAF